MIAHPQPRSLVSKIRGRPGISWIFGEGDSAMAGAGCGIVGGACCAGGALLTGLGISSSAAVSSLVGDAQPYFIAASVVMMVGWVFWIARRARFKPRVFAPMLVRDGLVMAVIYGVVLLTSMGLASLAGVSMM